MGVHIGPPSSYYIDDYELCLMRARTEDIYRYDSINLVPARPTQLRKQFYPGGIVALDQKYYEILAAFRLEEAPYFWRFVCQEVPDLTTVREVPPTLEGRFYGFDWSLALPRIIWDFMFQNVYDVHQFFKPLWAPKNCRFYLVTTQELLAGTVLVRGDQTRVEIDISIPDPRIESPIYQEFNLIH